MHSAEPAPPRVTGPPLPPAVAVVRAAVRTALAEFRDHADPLVLVACSGGPDSSALAAATAAEARRAGVRAGAVVVDHGWHADSAAVAARAALTCADLGLDPVDVETIAARPRRSGPEGDARDGRYSALEAARGRHGAVAVLLGHTLDDQAETVLLGLARGSGARSLAGMAAARGALRRPLLGVRRATTVAACGELGLECFHDPSNADPAYLRARVRRAAGVLAQTLGPALPEALARSADLLRQDADALDALARDLLAAAWREGGLDVARLAAAAPAVRRRALLAAAAGAGCPAGALSHRHADALDALVVAWHGQGPTHLPGGVTGERACGRLRLVPDRQDRSHQGGAQRGRE